MPFQGVLENIRRPLKTAILAEPKICVVKVAAPRTLDCLFPKPRD